jgi:penicillin-binding protein 1C
MWFAGVAALATLLLAVATWQALAPLPATLELSSTADGGKAQVLAADGTALSIGHDNPYNRTAALSLSAMPLLLRQAFVAAEDQRYWQHGGVDWLARLAALSGNLRAGEIERGASSIGEQASRILHPRARSYWGHWMAGWDATRLLDRFGHARVLRFYLNQVPYGGQRRGVAQAARYYFGRDVRALDPAEQLALAVLVRSPARYDPRRHPRALRRAVARLARRMHAGGIITSAQWRAIRRAPVHPGRRSLRVKAGAFVVFARQRARALGLARSRLHTTLDPALQAFVQQTLRRRAQQLAGSGIANGAALVVDNATGAVLAWALTPGGDPFGIDPVITPRQPGSALKPFVYALALADLGWQPDHVLRDTPLSERIEAGVHTYRNYSGRHYGRVSLRYALANSLNIPAVRTAQAVGVPRIIAALQRLGFDTFRHSADYYGPAIVLGDGGVTLFDMVQGYASLARHGRFVPLHVLKDAPRARSEPVLPAPVASLLANILSDPDARAAEFGADSILDFPVPTAVKTGTSSDYHDAWTMGFDDRYTVGVWMGRLDGGATDHLTGSIAAAPIVRRIFAHLRRGAPYTGLWHSPALRAVRTCEWIGPPPCVSRRDWYLPHTGGAQPVSVAARPRPAITQPLEGETLAIDPRVPRRRQQFVFRLDGAGRSIHRVRWRLDGRTLATGHDGVLRWTLQTGAHKVTARAWLDGSDAPLDLGPVHFRVLGPPASRAAGRRVARPSSGQALAWARMRGPVRSSGVLPVCLREAD